NILAIDDDRVLLDKNLLELSRWMGRYYCCPLGTVVESVIPSAVRRQVGMDHMTVVMLGVTPEKVQEALEATKARKRRAVLGRLLQIPVGGREDIAVLAGEAGCRI